MNTLNATSETLAVHGGAIPSFHLDRANLSSGAGDAGSAGGCTASHNFSGIAEALNDPFHSDNL